MNNTAINSKPKKLIINRGGLKVMRLAVSAGESIAEHATNGDLVVVVTKGEGIFYIDKVPHDINQGDVLDLAPNVPHAIDAKDDLELIVTHMQLKLDGTEISCGSEKCSHG